MHAMIGLLILQTAFWFCNRLPALGEVLLCLFLPVVDDS
jgi:hypothetical protein